VRHHKSDYQKGEDEGQGRDGQGHGTPVDGIVGHALIAIVCKRRDHRIDVAVASGAFCLGGCYCQFVLVMEDARASIDCAARYGYVGAWRVPRKVQDRVRGQERAMLVALPQPHETSSRRSCRDSEGTCQPPSALQRKTEFHVN
jgi:hypothetical protein